MHWFSRHYYKKAFYHLLFNRKAQVCLINISLERERVREYVACYRPSISEGEEDDRIMLDQSVVLNYGLIAGSLAWSLRFIQPSSNPGCCALTGWKDSTDKSAR